MMQVPVILVFMNKAGPHDRDETQIQSVFNVQDLPGITSGFTARPL